MSDFIFLLIVVGFFVFRARNKRAKNEGEGQKRRTQTGSYQRANAQPRGSQPNTEGQQALKARLQQKYAQKSLKGQSSPGDRPQASGEKSAILARARENVHVNEKNTMQQELHAEVCEDYRMVSKAAPNVAEHKAQSPDCDQNAESDIMKKVSDLIITGYSGDMTFERDFIAEGVDMLNRFSL